VLVAPPLPSPPPELESEEVELQPTWNAMRAKVRLTA
jgi:hypothetical protein